LRKTNLTIKKGKTLKRSWFVVVTFLFVSAIAGISQELRSEVSVQATGFFTKNSDGNGISQETTESGGVLAGYRYRINHWFSAEANYGYNRNNQRYFTSNGASQIQANIHSVTGDLVVNLPFKFHKLLPYALGGGGALIFNPTNNSGGFVTVADTRAQGAFVYGGGADYGLTRRLSLRAEYRGLVYKAPSFGLSNLNTDSWTHTALPSAGLVMRF
jgi:outer membrane immunogenic protein